MGSLSECLLERRGQILNSFKILKNYQMPKLLRPWFLRPTPGIQNFYWAETMPVCSCACPSVPALRGLLDMLGAGRGGDTKIVVIDLREELSVYIRGRPYCLRDLHAPASNLHHAGISSQRMQKMEEALQEDVQAEAARFQGSVMAHFESQVEKELPEASNVDEKGALNPSRRSSVMTRKFDEAPGIHVKAEWEPVPGQKGDPEGGTCTPLAAYSSLSDQGYAISYTRVPLSRERTPLTEDLDLIHSCISEEVLADQSSRKCIVMFLSHRYGEQYALCNGRVRAPSGEQRRDITGRHCPDRSATREASRAGCTSGRGARNRACQHSQPHAGSSRWPRGSGQSRYHH